MSENGSATEIERTKNNNISTEEGIPVEEEDDDGESSKRLLGNSLSEAEATGRSNTNESINYTEEGNGESSKRHTPWGFGSGGNETIKDK